MAVLGARRVLLIANPASRRGASRIHAAETALARGGCHVDRRQTTAPGDATRFAHERQHDVDAVFTLGGDGTVMEVLQALRGSGTPVGIVPAGTGNLLARALRIPLDVDRAVAALLRGTPRDFDLGAVAGDGGAARTFAFAAGIGMDVSMIQRASSRAKRRLGILAYVLAAGTAAWRHERFRVTVVTDGAVTRHDAVLTLVANFGAVLHSRLALGPGILPDDGQLDVCIYAPRHVLDSVRLLWRILRRDFTRDERMYFVRGAEIVIQCEHPRILQADGEIIGRTPARITVLPAAARLIVPHDA